MSAHVADRKPSRRGPNGLPDRRRRLVCALLSLLFLFGLPVASLSQEAQTAITKRILTDGVRLILKPEPTSEVVAITIFLRMEPDNTPQEAATGQMVSEALFYSSQHRVFDSVADSVRRVGGSLETLHAPDYVAITCVTVAEQLREASYLLCEALKNADFAEEALARARKQIFANRKRREANDFASVQFQLIQRFHALPEPEDSLLLRVTPAAAQQYFRSRYLPERTVVTVVGKFAPKVAYATFDNNLFDYDRKPDRPARFATSPPPIVDAPLLKFTSKSASGYALDAVPAPGIADPDYPAYTVLHAILGVGHASRLFRRVRDALGIGYEVEAVYSPHLAEPMIAFLQWDAKRNLLPRDPKSPEPPNAASDPLKVLGILQQQVGSLLTDPPSEAEIARARNIAIGRDALRHERARDRAFYLGWYEVMGLGFAFDADLPKRIAAVTHDEVMRVARRYLHPTLPAVIAPPLP